MLRAKDARADAARDRRREIGGTSARSTPSAATARSVLVARSSTSTVARRAPTVSETSDENRLRGLVERHRATEDLADRVEEVDLLIALGELVRRVLDLERRLQILCDDREEKAHEYARRSTLGRGAGPTASHARRGPGTSGRRARRRSAVAHHARLVARRRKPVERRETRASTRRGRPDVGRPSLASRPRLRIRRVCECGEDLARGRSFAMERHSHDAAAWDLDALDASPSACA